MKYLLSFLLGAVVGAAVALLYAPSSGEELRTNIKTRADSQYAKLQDDWQKGMQEVQTRVDKMSNDLQAMTSKGKETGKTA
jgi:gas vesicle protein